MAWIRSHPYASANWIRFKGSDLSPIGHPLGCFKNYSVETGYCQYKKMVRSFLNNEIVRLGSDQVK